MEDGKAYEKPCAPDDDLLHLYYHNAAADSRRRVGLFQVLLYEVLQRVVDIVEDEGQNYHLAYGKNAQPEVLSVYDILSEYLSCGVGEVEDRRCPVDGDDK